MRARVSRISFRSRLLVNCSKAKSLNRFRISTSLSPRPLAPPSSLPLRPSLSRGFPHFFLFSPFPTPFPPSRSCILAFNSWLCLLVIWRQFCFLSRFCVNATLGFTCLRSLWPAFVPCFICVIWQSSTAALPFYPVVVIVAMFVFIAFPLTVVGAIVGRNMSSDFKAPCRTTRVPRQVTFPHVGQIPQISA